MKKEGGIRIDLERFENEYNKENFILSRSQRNTEDDKFLYFSLEIASPFFFPLHLHHTRNVAEDTHMLRCNPTLKPRCRHDISTLSKVINH